VTIGGVDKHLIFNAAKEIVIKALETSNPLSAAFGSKEANEIGDVFNALVTKLAQSFKTL
jgi:hypothetical protein